MSNREPALSNPTHKVVGPDGTEYFLIRQSRNTLRIKILFSTVDYIKGYVSEGHGPSAADAVMMGAWVGPLRFHFGAAIDCLPYGAHCVEIAREGASLYDYQTDVIAPTSPSSAPLRRAGLNVGRYGRGELPVTRPQIAEVRVAMWTHRRDLLNGTYRRDDGPMTLNVAPVIDPAADRPTYVRTPGTPVPDALLAEFVADVDAMVDYLDFLMTLPPMPERDRTAPVGADQLAAIRRDAAYCRPGDEAVHAWRLRTIETGIHDPAAYDAANARDIRAKNAVTAANRLARAAA